MSSCLKCECVCFSNFISLVLVMAEIYLQIRRALCFGLELQVKHSVIFNQLFVASEIKEQETKKSQQTESHNAENPGRKMTGVNSGRLL